MTKQIQMRLIATVEDGVSFTDLSDALLRELRARGEEVITSEGFHTAHRDDMMNQKLVFWRATDIRRGPQTVERKKTAKEGMS